MLSTRTGMRNVHRGDELDLTLHAQGGTGRYYAVATVSLSLNQHGLQCPDYLGNPAYC
jgi:hypothetical protein